MAGTCFKCPVSLTVFKRSFCVTPRSGPASRTFFYGGRLGEKGVQEGCWAARPTALRTVGSFRFPAYFCFSCQESMSESLRTCYLYLNQTSRSFAAVIQALDGELRHAVCIFYLVLRALDTVEDDMTIPFEKKVPMLNDFHTYLYQADWCFTESHERDKQVLEDFATISLEFRNLGQEYQDVISDICQRMGVGMAEFLEKKVGSMKEWDQYCHYVAGLVGIGLSQLFSASQLEDPEVGRDTELANSMGLFLQKTNIIRDYLEDIQVARAFWPQEAWSQFACHLEDLAEPAHLTSALSCLNLLVTDALRHVPDVISYLARLRNQSVFNFCAIPQMLHRVSLTDPSRDKTLRILRVIQERTVSQTTLPSRTTHLSPIYLSAAMLIAALSWQYLSTGQPEGNTDMQGH
ncbi:squalene synthase isoform X4 [Esox lucius]|uniref:squalene synthase isoform X4 n=1 Tax=Esox lucius TaxID=8010 RepID=UPI000661E791|nr:squalene synthase isoform X4 [Esox lucius]